MRHYLRLEIVPVLRGHFWFLLLTYGSTWGTRYNYNNKPAVYWEQGKNVIRQRKDKEKNRKKRKEKKLTHINGKTGTKINHAQKNQAKNCGSGKK